MLSTSSFPPFCRSKKAGVKEADTPLLTDDPIISGAIYMVDLGGAVESEDF